MTFTVERHIAMPKSLPKSHQSFATGLTGFAGLFGKHFAIATVSNANRPRVATDDSFIDYRFYDLYSYSRIFQRLRRAPVLMEIGVGLSALCAIFYANLGRRSSLALPRLVCFRAVGPQMWPRDCRNRITCRSAPSISPFPCRGTFHQESRVKIRAGCRKVLAYCVP
jgi:hypothetical protein